MNSALNVGIENLDPAVERALNIGVPVMDRVDPGMDMQVAVRPGSLPLFVVLVLGLIGAGVFWTLDYPGVAGVLALVLSFEALLGVRRLRSAPMAVCGQGMRWWLVSQDGEMIGPFWLDESTRHGRAWMTLCLHDADKRRQRILLGRWNVASDGWRSLKWRVLEQVQHLNKRP